MMTEGREVAALVSNQKKGKRKERGVLGGLEKRKKNRQIAEGPEH